MSHVQVFSSMWLAQIFFSNLIYSFEGKYKDILAKRTVDMYR